MVFDNLPSLRIFPIDKSKSSGHLYPLIIFSHSESV